MTRPTEETVLSLMALPPSEQTGQALLAWVNDLQNCIARGDMMLGLISRKEVERVPAACAAVTGLASAESWKS